MAEEYTFYVQFSGYVPLYRGITRTWIGNGSAEPYQESGVLYAEFINNEIQRIGPISDYYYALENGYEGTFEQWVQFMLDTTDHVINAEKWAIGKMDATASDTFVPGMSAKEQADRSAMWAAGTSTGDGTATNNSKYWAEQSKIYSDGVDFNDQKQTNDNAKDYRDKAKDWATKERNVEVEENLYSAMHYAMEAEDSAIAADRSRGEASDFCDDAEDFAEQAKIYATGDNLDGQHITDDNALYYKNLAHQWATFASGADTPSQTNNSKYWALQSKDWATKDTVVDQGLYSAKKYAENASVSASSAQDWATKSTEVETGLESAKTYATNAGNSAALAKDWATKSTEVETGLESAKTYATNAGNSAASARDWATKSTEVETGLYSAKKYAENASASSVSAENWATGGSGGTASATNNAKYWADQAEAIQAEMEDRITDLGNFLSSVEIKYQNSPLGSTPPSGEWQNNPSPVPGNYVWTRMRFTWTDGSPETISYAVGYEGMDTGSGIVEATNADIDLLFA